MRAFPRDLARAVASRWNHIVAGDYEVPPCPNLRELTHILESCYLAASSPEESRYPSFNIVITPTSNDLSSNSIVSSYPFSQSRALNVTEIRRLAPAVDIKKSAIWGTYSDRETFIEGIVDLGTSWHRSRAGFSYQFKNPQNLIVQVERPGRLKVYQGPYHVASLADGDLIVPKGIEFNLFLHETVNHGLSALINDIIFPKFEPPKEYEGFWFTALWNIFAAIANTISSSGHGGIIAITPNNFKLKDNLLRIKYNIDSNTLRSSFINFINTRNVAADFYEQIDPSQQSLPSEHFLHESAVNAALDQLTETIRFVSQFAGCDGAIVVTSDLKIVGFGAEIRAEMAPKISIFEVHDEMRRKYHPCDIEQFGMRHRSAIKIASRMSGGCILAISQDGPITAVWREKDRVFVKKGSTLTNLNMPWM